MGLVYLDSPPPFRCLSRSLPRNFLSPPPLRPPLAAASTTTISKAACCMSVKKGGGAGEMDYGLFFVYPKRVDPAEEDRIFAAEL